VEGEAVELTVAHPTDAPRGAARTVRAIRGLAAAACIGLFTGACGGADDQGGAETLTRAQRDSLVARLPVPGASGVGAALRARDALEERAEAHDSVGRQ